MRLVVDFFDWVQFLQREREREREKGRERERMVFHLSTCRLPLENASFSLTMRKNVTPKQTMNIFTLSWAIRYFVYDRTIQLIVLVADVLHSVHGIKALCHLFVLVSELGYNLVPYTDTCSFCTDKFWELARSQNTGKRWELRVSLSLPHTHSFSHSFPLCMCVCVCVCVCVCAWLPI